MNNNTFIFPKCKRAVSAILVTILLVALISIRPAAAEGQVGFQNISVDVAYHMITHHPRGLVILDVRNQSEYDLGHLYNAVLIPLYQLEARIGELDENKGIIVYCKSGARSEIACGILASHGFTKVYNMLGGILAWMEAGYPIDTTYHYVTVSTAGRGVSLEIEPLLLQMGCGCAQKQACPSGSEKAKVTLMVLKEENNQTIYQITYETNNATFEVTVSKTFLWTYKQSTHEVNRTASFASTEISTKDTSIQFYSLTYVVQAPEYNLSIYTSLAPLDSETYNSSFTVMNYASAGKSEIESLEFVKFNSSVTLSQLYASLGKVAERMGSIYLMSGLENDDGTIVQLAWNYYTMSRETEHLSRLVNRQLQGYDRVILKSSAIMMDYAWWECALASIVCSAAIGLVIGCAIVTMGVGFIACLAEVFSISAEDIMTSIMTGVGIVGACIVFCCCLGYGPCCP